MALKRWVRAGEYTLDRHLFAHVHEKGLSSQTSKKSKDSVVGHHYYYYYYYYYYY